MTIGVRAVRVHATWVFVALGLAVWFALHHAGVHPTLVGVAMGLLAPSTPRLDVDLIDVDQLIDLSDVDAARTTSQLARGSISVVEWLQHVLHPWTSYVIVPIFALANSGIIVSIDSVHDATRSPITWGVLAGLVIGKPIGVVIATRVAVGAGIANAPAEASRRHMAGIGAAAGIGFTVSLFITELAFDDPGDRADAKLAILAASVLAALFSSLILTTYQTGQLSTDDYGP
jgi:NhaA family Na+:H+ antiporter